MMNYDALRMQLVLHEGLRLKPYRDSVGCLTIGVGRNLDENGIRYDEAIIMLRHDMEEAVFELTLIFPGFALLPGKIQLVLADMMFNLGPARFKTFTKMIQAVKDADFQKMKAEMMNSKWFQQVGTRGQNLAHMVEEVIHDERNASGSYLDRRHSD